MSAILSTVNLRKADPAVITAALANFDGKPVADWLGATHQSKTGQFLRADGKPCKSLQSIRQLNTSSQMIEVLAALAPNHLIDGWGFLSRAISSLTYQDPHTTRHLSYYAQLRGAMSILAFSGVGIFNGSNFSVESQTQIHNIYEHGGQIRNNKRSQGTHVAVWETLKSWVTQPTNARYFFENVGINSTSAIDCVQSLWPSTSMNALAAGLIDSWGLDLQIGFEDHVRRNVSSYAAHELNPLNTTFSQDIDFIENFWSLVEPGGGDSFEQLDSFLLRSILWQRHNAVSSQQSNYASGAISTRYNDLPPLVSSRLTKDFLIGVSEPNDPLVLQKAAIRNQDDPLSMIARALLILRAASGFANRAFSDAGFKTDGSSVRPWLNSVGSKRGLWQDGSTPDLMSDLWDEVWYAVDDMRATSSAPSSAGEWLYASNNGMPIVCQSERAGLWSICP